MTERDKTDIAEIVAAALAKQGSGCSLGIKPETARELISFADTWKTCRKTMLIGLITVVAGGIIAAFWAGIKQMVK